MLTLDDLSRDICALRENVMVFERKYNMPTEVFYEAYARGEEPDDSAWVLDWSEWAGSYQLLQKRLATYNEQVRRLIAKKATDGVSQLMQRTVRHEPIAIAD